MKKIILSISAILIFSNSIYALGTDANTQIDNSATLSYSAGGVSQPDVTSNTDSFVVDKKIDMVLITDDTTQTEVTPGQTDQITNYSFKNEGNSKENFKFEVVNLPNNEEADYNDKKDNDDVNNLRIEYSTDGGSSWDALPDDGILQVDEDANITLRVKADIKNAEDGGENNDVMNIELKATAYKDDKSAAEEETTDADTQNSVDVVFADGVDNATLGSSNQGKGDTPRDGKEAARSGYIIQTPVLSADKTSCVISDPVNGTNKPKRIPGAIIRYMFDITNSGSADVTDLNITDSFDSNLLLDNTKDSAKKDENVDSCSCSDGASNDISSDTTINNQDLTITNISIQQNKHTCVSVEVEIK